ncbi:MAG: nucleotidyltransferase domain-containing protein [Bacilli bacterium]|nr:nucleotidyltransferase domain-containing protein [Bacilli bacterium]
MQNWELSIEKFISQYKDEDYFLGAILTGSYATGNYDENSDIDIYIVTKDNLTWRERGNKNIDGFLIEYFINPKKKILSYFESELKDYHLSTTMIFINGKILYDKDGSVQELINIANKNFNLEDVNEYKYKMNCYSVWDGFDELESKYKKKEDIDFTYNIFLQRVIEGYFYNKQIPCIPLNKIQKIFTNENYRKKYNVQKLPEQEFIEKVLNCFNAKEYNDKYKFAKELYDYFFLQFNDFDINNLEVRSNIE